MPEISVIICSHNQTTDILARTIEGLRSQTFPKADWEFLVVDNRSDDPLEGRLDLSWHPNARMVWEDNLGVVFARLRGIAEASGDLIVFVDDDNVLEPDYLQTALRISAEYPWIGVWGGQCLPDFETPPPNWCDPYWCYLPLRTLDRDLWTNIISFEHVPFGCGMCIRKTVAQAYAARVADKELRQILGRGGTGEDSDMCFTACDMGLGMGLFKDLKLTHIMPSSRFSPSNLARLLERTKYTSIIVLYLHGKVSSAAPKSTARKLFDWYVRVRMDPRQRMLHDAIERGEQSAYARLKELGCPVPCSG